MIMLPQVRILRGLVSTLLFSITVQSHDKAMSWHGVVDKPLALYPGVLSLIPGSSSMLDETLSRGPVSI